MVARQHSNAFRWFQTHLKKVRDWGASRGKKWQETNTEGQIPPENVEQPQNLLFSCCILVNSQVVYFLNDTYVYLYHLQGNDVAQGGKKRVLVWKLMWVRDKHSSVILVERSRSCRESRWARYIQFLSSAEVVWRARLSPALKEEKQWAQPNDSSCFKPARCENAEGPDR